MSDQVNTYSTKIVLSCDTGKLRYDPDTGTAKILGDATIPPRLARYAHQNGHDMPEGLYGFFGVSAVEHLQAEVLDHLKRREQGSSFLWDLESTLTFTCQQGVAKRPVPLMWKDPSYLQASFVRVTKPSKEVADLLRYFTGDKNALDRLTLEPWRIDTYAAVLSEVYGPMKALVFDALMDDDSIVPIIRIYDRSLLGEEDPRPLYQILSSRDPSGPEKYHAPDSDWLGWGVPDTLSALDRADIIAYRSVPKDHRKEREALKMRRVRSIRQEGRFAPRDEELKVLVERRLSKTRPGKSERSARSGTSGSLTGGGGDSGGSSANGSGLAM